MRIPIPPRRKSGPIIRAWTQRPPRDDSPWLVAYGRASGTDVSAKENAHKACRRFAVSRKTLKYGRSFTVLFDQAKPPHLATKLRQVLKWVRAGHKINLIMTHVSRVAHDLNFGLLVADLLVMPNFRVFIGATVVSKQEFLSRLQMHAEQYARKEAQADATRRSKTLASRQHVSFTRKANGKFVIHKERFESLVVPLFEARNRIDPFGLLPKNTIARKIAAHLNQRHKKPWSAKRYTANLVRNHLSNSLWFCAYMQWKLSTQDPS